VRPGAGPTVGGCAAHRAALLLLLPVVLGFSSGGARHPIHSSLTQLALRPDGRTVQITMRVFADDFAAAVARRPPGGATGVAPADGAAFAYVAAVLTLTDGTGRPMPLRWGGARRTNDVLWLTLTVPATTLRGVSVGNRVLFDLNADQVNIVQAEYGGRRQSVLFTKGSAAKRLP
jgi:hypothetical protein